MSQFVVAVRGEPDVSVADHPLGNSVGAIGWFRGDVPFAGHYLRNRALRRPFPLTNSALRGHRPRPFRRAGRGDQDSYLVDSASSHMLVSKIKPCMSKYKQSIL